MEHQSNWRESLFGYLRQNALPVEKYGHQPRLYGLARQLSQGMDFDDDILCAAAWLHDLGVFVGHRPEGAAALAQWDSVGYAVEKAPALLKQFGFPPSKVDAVLACIRTHQPQQTPETVEAILLRDADILEQLGAVGILRTVCKVGRDTRFHTFTDAVNSLRRAHDTLPALIRLEVTRTLAEPRLAILTAWLSAVDEEAGANLS